MTTLLLKFSGPLQSWGSNSKFETRHTEKYPTKSAVIGLIAGSMGLRRNDPSIEALNELDMAVRIDQPGNIIQDYQIAQKYKQNGNFDRTYVTRRYYIEDAVFVVGVESNDEELIKKIEHSLQTPYFQPFLGRRANAINADFIQGTSDLPLKKVLIEFPWQAAKWYKKHRNDLPYLEIIGDRDVIQDNVRTFFMRDYVKSFSQNDRQFNFRTVAQTVIPNPDKKGTHEHDAFNGVMEDD